MTESHDEPESAPERTESSGAAPRMARFGDFVHDTRAELNRVSWPTALQVRNTTIITIIAVIFFAVYLFVVDRTFSFVIEQIQRLVGAA
jgi:preprotein translocase SecE subunit